MKYRNLSELHKLEDNPRTIDKESFASLCQSIQDNPDYFEARPLILSNRTGKLVILGGNQRYEAAKKLGLEKVPTPEIEEAAKSELGKIYKLGEHRLMCGDSTKAEDVLSLMGGGDSGAYSHRPSLRRVV